MNFSIGDTVGAYRILEELGRGGMGRVFKVEHSITRRHEAMKVLEGGRPDAPEQAARSLREIQLQASLGHRNIAAVHNAFWADEHLVLVMELIDGSSLRSVLEAGRLPLGVALDYTCQALSALSYAHAHGVIHRDVSPANMMINPSGALKLTDFGLAKGPGDARISQSGGPLGSLYYMSPEQVRGAKADACSDIYSLGAVLYELTTGKKPFEGESAFAIMVDQTGKPPVAPNEVQPDLPPALNTAILRSLEKDPANRFQSADEFLQALTDVRGASAFKSPASSSLSRSRVWGAASVAVAALAIAGLFADGHWRKNWRKNNQPTIGPVVQSVGPVPTPPESGSVDPIATQPVVLSQPVPTRPALSQPSGERRTLNDPGPRAIAPHVSASTTLTKRTPAASTPNEDGSGENARRDRNPVVKALAKIWHLGRHKKSPSGDDIQPASESQP